MDSGFRVLWLPTQTREIQGFTSKRRQTRRKSKMAPASVSYRNKWRNSTKKQKNCLRQHERFQIQEESETPLEEMFPQEVEKVFKSFLVGLAVRSFALCAKIGSNKWVKNHHFWAQLPHCFTSVEVSRGEYYWPPRLWWIIVLYFTFFHSFRVETSVCIAKCPLFFEASKKWFFKNLALSSTQCTNVFCLKLRVITQFFCFVLKKKIIKPKSVWQKLTQLIFAWYMFSSQEAR